MLIKPVKFVTIKLHQPIVYIVRNIYGENYTLGHRMVAGVVIAACGVALANVDIYHSVNMVFEGIGYTFHAMGITPFLDGVMQWSKQVGQTVKADEVTNEISDSTDEK